MTASEHLDFSLALHRQLAPEANRPFCWSPYSVASALALVAAGTGGRTHDEIDAALCPRSPGRNHANELLGLLGPAAELAAAGSTEAPALAVANTLWAHEELPIRDSFVGVLKDWPGSAIRNAPFRTDPESARNLINEDVAETTHGLIPELLAPGTVHPETIAALVNAMYLKTSWREPFDSDATVPRPFATSSGSRDVPTMHVTRRYGYAARNGWQVVGLPAVGDVEAVVLLPDGELRPAENSLTSEGLEALLTAPETRRLELSLPRFRVTGDAELDGPLAGMGVRTLFTTEADFSPLTDASLRVSTAVHQSVLEVDENGLEGAAATAVMMRLTAIARETEEPIRVAVDRPFLFLVRHRPTGALYFLARVTDPA